MRTAGLWMAGACVLLLWALPASAHRGHTSLTVVEIELKGGDVTVTHYLAAHDVEPALRQIAPKVQPNLDDEEAMQALIAHVAARFWLADAAGTIGLQLKDVKLAGDDVRLVYTGRMSAPRGELELRSSLFTEVYSDQHNQVNVRREGVTRTLNFTRGDEARALPATVNLP